jgi:hypothetical protein
MNDLPKKPLRFGNISLEYIARQHIERVSEVVGALTAVVTVANEELTSRECGAIAQLFHRGCRMFAFVGPHSEQSHDRFDEILQEIADDVSMTTYHVDESSDDTAAMLVVYIRDRDPQRILLIDGSQQLSSRLIESFERAALESGH